MVKWEDPESLQYYSIYITGFINPEGSRRTMSMFLLTEHFCMNAGKIKVKMQQLDYNWY